MLNSLLARRTEPVTEARSLPMSWQAYQELFTWNGSQYFSTQFSPMSAKPLLAACGPAFAVLDRRASVMGEARPVFQRFDKGKPGDLFSTPALDRLKKPWPGGTFRLLAMTAESDVASSGNSYWIDVDRQFVRLDPDWVTIVTEQVVQGGVEIAERLLGYVVHKPGSEPYGLDATEIAHYRPGPAVGSPFRGESWLASVASDASSDVELTKYKANYLRNGAMPSIAVTYEPTLDMAELEKFVPLFAEKFTGSLNAGKVMHFLGGSDVKTVGASLDDLAFKAVQGAGETRIAAAAGVPASVAGFSEGMQGSSLNAGNYTATRRLFGDAKVRPLLGSFMEAFSTLIAVPADSRLWYDDSQVSFFQEDVTDEATIRSTNAQTIRSLIEAGYEPDAALAAVTTGNFDALKGKHTGLTSVQLQEPGATPPPTDTP